MKYEMTSNASYTMEYGITSNTSCIIMSGGFDQLLVALICVSLLVMFFTPPKLRLVDCNRLH